MPRQTRGLVTYPAILSYDIPGEVGITFPDFSGCTGQCKADSDVYAYAQETLGFYLADVDEADLPVPTDLQNIEHEDMSAVCPVRIYLPAYREELYSKSVARTVTIPYWLNKVASETKINFSETMRDALMLKLGIHRAVANN